MEKAVFVAIGSGVLLAVGLFGFKGRTAPDASQSSVIPTELKIFQDSRYQGLPTEPQGFAPHGWITVIEPPPHWNPQGQGVAYPICPRPEWFPYKDFIGPPVPEVAIAIDPGGYMFQTAEGIRVHRDGWVVTADGRAFRAKDLVNDMPFPKPPTASQGV